MRTRARRLPIGGELSGDRAHFRVWAPKPRRIELVLCRGDSQSDGHQERIELEPEPDGYYSANVEGVAEGSRYGFRLDGQERIYPDPASRFQPDGPAGLSQLVDGSGFAWTDAAWPGLGAKGQVLYEMHIGTFTRQGTWAAAARELPELARIGITALEVMPVAEFPGEFGWGYDGVLLFAPSHLYGSPDDFRRFIDAAHAAGIGVILDVVYNHFGNVDNYVGLFSGHYDSDRYENEWGGAINFDGEGSGPVREFFESNARYWVEEFHLDGFRFDATQAIHDASPRHILATVTEAARQAAGSRSLYLIAENEPQDVTTVRMPDEGGHGMDAVWNDDFHHAAIVRLTGRNPAYYSDYNGTGDEFIACLKHGFLYQGQRSVWQGKRRGTPTRGLPATAFVTFLENHDQVANSADGSRLTKLTSAGRYRAMTALWLLAPQTPLFFQGQEFGASNPFIYFADYSGSLAKSVIDGRGKFLKQFPHLATAETQHHLPNPTDPELFRRAKLDFAERETNEPIYHLHIDLLKLRRGDPIFSQGRADWIDAAEISPDCIVVRYFGPAGQDRLILVNWGRDLLYAPAPQPLLAPPEKRVWNIMWSSESLRYGGRGTPPLDIPDGWRIPGEAAVVLQASALEEDSPSNVNRSS